MQCVNSTRSRCLVCVRDFNPVWRKKHTCRMCGDVVCSRCSVHKHVDLPLKDNLFRICTWCFLRVRQSPPTLVAVAAVKEIDDDQFLDSDYTRSTEDVDDDQSEDDGMMYNVVEDFVDPDLELLKMREQELEAQVKASRLKVDALEAQIQESERHVNLTTKQQRELAEARALIADLQRQLQEKETAHYTARMTIHEDAFHHRMSLTGSTSSSRRPSSAVAPPLRHPPPPPSAPSATSVNTTSHEEDAARLRRQLAKMTRQMTQAGLNVADDIPYEEAKQRVAEISRRMQEIGSAEVVVLDNPRQQAALRKEYFQLEQDMEKYNTALMVSDEYMAEQAAVAKRWEDRHAVANEAALRTLRSCVPVDMAMLSEKQLTAQLNSPDLARKLKRANVLGLCRMDPSTIQRMHPSLVEGYRVVGLSVLERRALHVVLAAPMAEWKKQAKDELAKRKLAWAVKLRDALVAAMATYDSHLGHATEATHVCNQRHQCPVTLEAKARALYATDLGYPQDAVYYVHEVVQATSSSSPSDPPSQRDDAATEGGTQERLALVKRHYKGNVLQVTQAMGAIEEMNATLLALAAAETALVLQHGKDTERLAALVLSARDAIASMAKRSGICLVGKRDRAKDKVDCRSSVEASVAQMLAAYVDDMRDEMEVHMLCVDPVHKCVAWLQALASLVPDVKARNAAKMIETGEAMAGHSAGVKRTSWKDIKVGATGVHADGKARLRSCPATLPPHKAAGNGVKPGPPLNFLEELKKAKAAKASTPANDMLAKIRARRNSKAESTEQSSSDRTTKFANTA
ncbi:hypothetical protein B5M09_002332 [Aphanomyces astaci]|uniref:FYVE-type domain-containing protein n=1 Tax=Aphanomyces astaci TaxID=112090 RepID=A0A3R7Y313_APHAT|nr:hypothetical protein B5M09_002332 [Aphanomyces astaci]